MTTIKFEGEDTTANGVGSPIPDLYGGMHWQGIYAMNSRGLGDEDPYTIGTHSGRTCAYNDPTIGIPQKFSSDVTFSLKSMYIASLNGPADITFRAYSGDTLVGHTTLHIGAGDDVFFFHAKFKHITAVQIVSPENQAIIDDIRVVFDAGAHHPASGDMADAMAADAMHTPFAMHHELLSIA